MENYKPTLYLKKEEIRENGYKTENSISELKILDLICNNCILCNTLLSELIYDEDTEQQNLHDQENYYKEYYQYFIIDESYYYDKIVENFYLPFDIFYNYEHDITFVAFSDLGTNRDLLQGLTIEELKTVYKIEII